MHQILILDVWNFIMTIKSCVHYFHFCYQNETFEKLSKVLFVLPKSSLLSSRLSIFCSSLFPSFFHSWPLLILRKKLIDNKFESLWHFHVPKLGFKDRDSLISGEVKFWSWYLVNWQKFFTEKLGCVKANLNPP